MDTRLENLIRESRDLMERLQIAGENSRRLIERSKALTQLGHTRVNESRRDVGAIAVTDVPSQGQQKP